MILSVILFGFSFLIFVIAFIYIKIKKSSEFSSLLTSAITTFVSFLLSASLALFIYNYQIQSDRDSKLDDLKKILRADFSEKLKNMENEGNRVLLISPTYSDSVIVAQLNSEVIVNCINSGLFDTNSTIMLISLKTVISNYNLTAAAILNTLPQLEEDKGNAKFLGDNNKRFTNSIKNQIRKIWDYLEFPMFKN